MRRQLNPIEHVLHDINEKINCLFLSDSPDGRLIGDINEKCQQNLFYSKEIVDLFITRSIYEKTSSNKLKILYVIDSLIKNFGKDFISYLSPHIFRIFEETYVISDETQKLNLFKLHYSWRYFIDMNILESINSRFNFNEIKKNLLRDKPEIIEKYDRFNEGVREGIIREAKIGRESLNSITNDSSIKIQPYVPNIINPHQMASNLNYTSDYSGNTGYSNNHQATSTYQANKINSSIQPQIDNQPNTIPINIHNIKIGNSKEEMKNQNNLTDSYDSYSKKESVKLKKDQNKFLTKKTRMSEVADEFEKISHIKIKKKSTKKPEHSLKKHIKREEKDPKFSGDESDKFNYNDMGNTFSQNVLNLNNINSQSNFQNQKIMQGNLLFNLQQILTNPNVLSLYSQGNFNLDKNILNYLGSSRENSQQAGKSNKNSSLHNNKESIVSKQAKKNGTYSIKESSFPSVLKKLDSFISQNIKFEKGLLFFSTFTKIFTDSESEPLIELFSKKLKQNLQLKTDILNFQNDQLFYDTNKKSINELCRDVKKQCSVCGFRTKFSNKFTQHLDIHFNINFIKRQSHKKVLYRKEFDDKYSWIQAGLNRNKPSKNKLKYSFLEDVRESLANTYSDVSSNANEYSFTLGSVMYYLNDSEQNISKLNVNMYEDNFKENEQTMVPVGPIECYCIYCGGEFKMKFSPKFNFWFYINVVKFRREEIESLNQGRVLELQRSDNNLIHESCIEEYVKMVRSGLSDKFFKGGEIKIK